MKVPVFVVSAFLGAAILLEAWTLNALVDLKAEVSAIKAQLNIENIARK